MTDAPKQITNLPPYCPPETSENTHIGRHTKSARPTLDGEIIIRIGSTEYVMPVSEANDLIGLINNARHQVRV